MRHDRLHVLRLGVGSTQDNGEAESAQAGFRPGESRARPSRKGDLVNRPDLLEPLDRV